MRVVNEVYNLSRLLCRMANAFAKKEKWDQAISFYNKSLTEQRNADTLKFLQKVLKRRLNLKLIFKGRKG